METKEVLNFTSQFNMKFPMVTIPARKLQRKFAFGEPWWILTGSNRVEDVAQFNSVMRNFSDDGVTLSGAYGPPVMEQVRYIVDTLAADQDTRQAVLTIWRQNPRNSKDVPCTVSLQFFIRDGELHVIDTMRSSDAWLGWPYDVMTFTMVASYVVLRLRDLGFFVELGQFYLNAGSQHLYEKHYEAAKEILRDPAPSFGTVPLLLPHGSHYPFYSNAEEFVGDLKHVALGHFHEVINPTYQAVMSR
jgi:thymidylate synthase